MPDEQHGLLNLDGQAGDVTAGDVAGANVIKTTIHGSDANEVLAAFREELQNAARDRQQRMEYEFLDDQRRKIRQEQQDRERAQEREDMALQFASIGGRIDMLVERADRERIDMLVERADRERVQTRADHTLQFTNIRHHMELHGQRIDRLGQRVDYVGQHIDQMTTEQHQVNARIQRLMTVAVWIVVVIVVIIIALVAEFGGFVDVPIALIAASLSLSLYYVSHR